MRRWSNANLLLAHRLRRWANSKPALDQRLMFAGIRHITFTVLQSQNTVTVFWMYGGMLLIYTL